MAIKATNQAPIILEKSRVPSHLRQYFEPALCSSCYVCHTIEILREIRRVLRKDGVVFWNIGDAYFGGGFGTSPGGTEDFAQRYPKQASNLGTAEHEDRKLLGSLKKSHNILKPKDLCLIPFRVAISAQNDGWWVRSVIIWSKPNPMPESVTDRPTESHEYILMLTKSARYYWDASAVRERGLANSTGATSSTPLGSSAVTKEFSPTLFTDDSAFNLQGRCYLSESQITIVGTVAGNTRNLKVFKAISLTIIGEQSERQFMMDLQPSSDTAPLALIASTLKGLSANNTPVRATIVNATTSPSRAINPNPMFTIPSTNTSPTTEAMSQAFTMLTRIAEEGLPALVAIYSEELESPLLIRGTLRSAHIDHHTINTNRSQAKQRGLKRKGRGGNNPELGNRNFMPIQQEQHHGQDIIDDSTGRNIRSVWEFPTQPFPAAHFAVFPEKLPEICIKAATPEVGCCSKCGAPWERITKVNRPNDYNPSAIDERYAQEARKSGGQSGTNRPLSKMFKDSLGSSRETLGWHPTCKCKADKVPSLVLDPFLGAGTVAWVAKKLNRYAVGYEISKEYCRLSLDRNRQQILL